jgi:hypothetical protein
MVNIGRTNEKTIRTAMGMCGETGAEEKTSDTRGSIWEGVEGVIVSRLGEMIGIVDGPQVIALDAAEAVSMSMGGCTWSEESPSSLLVCSP